MENPLLNLNLETLGSITISATFNPLSVDGVTQLSQQGGLSVVENKPEPLRPLYRLDCTIKVDRSQPDSVRSGFELKYPKLAKTGPREYDLSSGVVKKSFLREQKEGREVLGSTILEILEEKKFLHQCFRTRDLRAIAKDIEVFRLLTSGAGVVLAWASVGYYLGHLWVPCVFEETPKPAKVKKEVPALVSVGYNSFDKLLAPYLPLPTKAKKGKPRPKSKPELESRLVFYRAPYVLEYASQPVMARGKHQLESRLIFSLVRLDRRFCPQVPVFRFRC